MPLIVSNTCLDLMREHVQDQSVRLSLHPTTPSPANEITGYTSPQAGQGIWSDAAGGEATNTLALNLGTLAAAIPTIQDVALRSSTEEVLMGNALTQDRNTLTVGTTLLAAAGALRLDFISNRGSANPDVVISNTLRTSLILTVLTACASASLHSAQPTDSTRPTDEREISTSTGYQRSPLNASNWSSPALDGVSRNQVVLTFGGELTAAIPLISHIAFRNSSGTILFENDLTSILRNLAIGSNITIPARDVAVRMLA